jgi:hypothetical protein
MLKLWCSKAVGPVLPDNWVSPQCLARLAKTLASHRTPSQSAAAPEGRIDIQDLATPGPGVFTAPEDVGAVIVVLYGPEASPLLFVTMMSTSPAFASSRDGDCDLLVLPVCHRAILFPELHSAFSLWLEGGSTFKILGRPGAGVFPAPEEVWRRGRRGGCLGGCLGTEVEASDRCQGAGQVSEE